MLRLFGHPQVMYILYEFWLFPLTLANVYILLFIVGLSMLMYNASYIKACVNMLNVKKY